MKKVLVCLLALVVGLGTAFAGGLPSSKATAAINTIVGCTLASDGTVDPYTGVVPMTCKDLFSGAAVSNSGSGFAEIMKASVKVSGSNSLVVTPSLVTGLYTNTQTKSKPDSGPSTAVAEGGVYLRAVLIDANKNTIVAYPLATCAENPILGCQQVGTDYGVVFDSRVQALTQEISKCVVDVVVNGTSYTGTCDFTSTIQLMQKTTSAHSFSYVFPNVGQGTYTVSIQAAVNANAEVKSGTGGAISAAAFGLGSVTIESVRLVHDFDITNPL